MDTLKLTVGIRIYPDTVVAQHAREEGLTSSQDDLLIPRFYLAKDLEEWLFRTVREWVAERPYSVS